LLPGALNVAQAAFGLPIVTRPFCVITAARAHHPPLQALSTLITIASMVLSISSELRHLRQLRAA